MLVALAIFDSRITLTDKRQMIQALNKPSKDKATFRVDILHKNVKDVKIYDFVTSRTKQFFTLNDIGTSFLVKDPSLWNEDADYQTALKKVKSLIVTNDVCERAIALAENINSERRTYNEEQYQCYIQSVHYNQKAFPSSSSKSLKQGLPKF